MASKPDDDLSSSAILSKIGSNVIVNVRTKEEVNVSSLWAERTVVIQFLRRFGCMLCRMACLHINRIKPSLDQHNVALVAIGFEWAGAEEFVKHEYLDGDVYVDAKRKCYNDLSFKKYTSTISALLALAQPIGRKALSQAWREGVHGNLLEGDGLQNGGQVIIHKGGKGILLLHREEVPGDCVENYAILKSLGIPCDEDTDTDGEDDDL